MMHISHYCFEGATFTQYNLENDTTSVAIVPEKGGMIVSMKLNGEEFSWMRKNNFEHAERPRCGVPVLFPSCGMPDGGIHQFDGKDYPMENHGFADLLPWEVVETGNDFLTLRLLPNGLTKFIYPFDFTLTITYRLIGNIISIEETVANTGDRDLPFSFGFHPYFVCSSIDNLEFNLQAEICTTDPKVRNTPAPEKVDFPYDANQTTRLFRRVKSPIIFSDRGNRHRVTIDFDYHIRNAVLWQQGAEQFVAVEPWNGWANSLNEPGEHEELLPGTSLTAHCSFKLEKK